jgi:RNA polymerase sigma factor (TIGR02999 family)
MLSSRCIPGGSSRDGQVLGFENRHAGCFAYSSSVSDVTRILDRVQQGEEKAAEELLPLVYEELRKLAAHRMAQEGPGQTLQPTALVHEVWLRLVGSQDRHWNGRGHFFAAAAEAMRRILIEAARRKQRRRHGGGLRREELRESHLVLERPSEEMLAVNEALEKLAREDGLAADLVKLRYFVGMTLPESAEALGISPRTADRLWGYARSWLRLEIEGGD